MTISKEAIEVAAVKAANAVGVTPYSDMRPFVEQAVKWALSTLPIAVEGKELTEFQSGQWWLEELEKHWGTGETTPQTRRAAKVALSFAEAYFRDGFEAGRCYANLMGPKADTAWQKYSATVDAQPASTALVEAGKRWRVFEDITHGWWGIEVDGDNDADPILYPIKINRERLDNIVEQFNAR